MRRLIALGAAFSAVIVLTTIYVVTRRESPPPAPASQSLEPTSSAPASQAASALLVRDGDTVEASGSVFAAPGRPVQFCPGDARAEPTGKPCMPGLWVEVRSVGLDTLTRRTVFGDVVVGYARLRGIWRDRILNVTSQGVPAEPTLPALPPLDPVPCEPPPGGWRGSYDIDGRAVHEYIEQHPGQFAAPWVAWPDGPPGTTTAAPDALEKPAVLVIEVISGDVDQARTELSRIATGNLCVARARPGVRPSGELQRSADEIMKRLDPVMQDRRNGIYSAGGDPSGRVSVDFLVLDQQLYDAFVRVGLNEIILNPWIRPASP